MSGGAPPWTCTRPAGGAGCSPWGTSQRCRSIGWATVAERPMVCICGVWRRRRPSPSDRRWPRLELTNECSSSRTTYFRSLKKRSASLLASSSATCSGVVSRISGGESFWRWRLACGVSPVRFSIVTVRPISETGFIRLRSISTASALSGEMYSVWMPVKAEPGGILPRRVRSVSEGRKPASVLPAPVGAISSMLSPAVARERSSS